MSTKRTTEHKDSQLVHASAALAVPPEIDDVRYMHAVLCQLGLPRRKIAEREWTRTSGGAWLEVQAGSLDFGDGRPVKQPIPYGAMPRLALAYISTQAVKTQSAEVDIGDSAAEFLSLMGLDREGRRYTTLRKQMNALAACTLTLGGGGVTVKGSPVTQYVAWHDNKNTGQRPLWPAQLQLGNEFFEALMNGAVPIDWRSMTALGGSALAMDIYTWLAHRLHRVGHTRPQRIYWKPLGEQFGTDYKNPKDFKKEFVARLRDVLAVYPQARVSQVMGGLELRNSPTPIPRALR